MNQLAAILKADAATASIPITLKLEVVAEGVETEAKLDFIRTHGCDEIQGYYLSQPLPARQSDAMLRKFERRATTAAAS